MAAKHGIYLQEYEASLDIALDELNFKIADQEAKESRDKIMKHFSFFSQNPDKIDLQKMWKSLCNA